VVRGDILGKCRCGRQPAGDEKSATCWEHGFTPGGRMYVDPDWVVTRFLAESMRLR
jgi:hypothetical protein